MALARMPSASSLLQQEDSQALMIHADGLPCLKRQQLENLCIRLGVKSTGKKSELIARLEGFALGKSASVMSNLNTKTVIEEEQEIDEQNVETDANAQEVLEQRMEEDEEKGEDGDISMLPNTASIRVISKPRESHFVSAMPDPFEMEVGVVLPSSGSSHGSLNSLASFSKRSVSGSTQKNTDVQSNLPTTQQDKPTKRTVSGSSLYPWKKLMGSHKASSDSLAKKDESIEVKDTQQTVSGPSATEMGLGLTASDSQASISSTVRKWLKGEGTSTITPTFPSNRRVTRSISAASSIINSSNAEETKGPLQQEVEQPKIISETPISKRKRSIGDDGGDDISYDDCGVPTSPEVPQRRIKPRPSRAKRSNVTPSMEAATSPSAQEKVWAEMQARMAAKAKESSEGGESRKASGTSSIGSGAQTPILPPSPLKSVNSRTKGRFSSQHDKQFGRMDSIASHYAARRDISSDSGRARKISESMEDDKQIAPAKKARLDAPIEEKEAISTTTNKTITIASADLALPQRTDEERAAIKRKLELARHRRRSSTAAARASASAATARRAAAAHSGPSSKLSNSIKSGGFASKISFAVRGFMGAAARGLTNNSTLASSSTSDKVKEEEVEKSITSSMGPPATPSMTQKTLEKKPSVQALSTNSPSKSSTALAKKKSTFDLQASLARKPTGYTPYSTKETVGLLNNNNHSPKKPSTYNSDSSSVSRSSSINFPSSSPVKKEVTCVKVEMDEDIENQEPSNVIPMPSTPVSPRVGIVKKTRSSASHSARSSIRTGRKSNANIQTSAAAAARASGARGSGLNGTPKSRKRQPSLQSINQTMAKDMITARRSRTNAMQSSTIPQRQFRQSATNTTTTDGHRRSSAAISATATLRNSTSSTINSPPPLPAPPAIAAAGHGSPRKNVGSSAFVEGKGRGKSSFLESGQDNIPRSSAQSQRKRSSQALVMRS